MTTSMPYITTLALAETWERVRARCTPVHGIENSADVTDDQLLTIGAATRRSRDELVVYLICLGQLRTRWKQDGKDLKRLETLTGYKEKTLQVGEKLALAVSTRGQIPPEWLGLGWYGIYQTYIKVPKVKPVVTSAPIVEADDEEVRAIRSATQEALAEVARVEETTYTEYTYHLSLSPNEKESLDEFLADSNIPITGLFRDGVCISEGT